LRVILQSMKRPIFVRPLSDAERESLEAGLRSPDAFTLRRCQWVHGKRKVVEPDGEDPLGAYELAERVCRVFDCPHYEHLSITENAA
jgi:hypothetical protein